MYSRNPARFGPNPKSYFNIELYKSEGQTLLDFWTVGYHTFPTREKNWKKNRTRYIEEGTADLLKLLNFSRLFHDCIYFVDKEVYKNLLNCSEWIFIIEEICDLTFECFFLTSKGNSGSHEAFEGWPRRAFSTVHSVL